MTHVDFLSLSPHFQALYASFSFLFAPVPVARHRPGKPCTCGDDSEQLWAWSLLLPGGPSGYCPWERWEKRPAISWRISLGETPGAAGLAEKGSTKTQGQWRIAARSWWKRRKARRLKQAKEEAQMEVEHYRREREQEFQSKQQARLYGP
ncbi:V-type proton ATPase subunit G 2 isoform X2 [Leopardus geoffroyi]|uniref:V-type proton ATPase subunit G 2 isoform X2 n=1 Tax=Leopardus geoffroyi TaxID=46844 RepID=UPI001E25FF32|nr:V-type proton ATPase subunit G 2 isoform X2 [Leopardus geoffroyi]